MSSEHKEMPPKARAAYEIYLAQGRGRTLKATAEAIDRSERLVRGWSAEYNWVALAAEHDNAKLKEGLGQRELDREHAMQRVVDMMDDAITVLHEVMMDDRKLPVLDRQGLQMRGPGGPGGKPGDLLYRPLVKASTRAMCAEKILGIGGLVPVKRTEVVDRTGEQLDAASSVIQALTPQQRAQLRDILDSDDGAD